MPAEVTIYTCPTGGWVMGNRHRMEEAVKKEMPDCQVTHKASHPTVGLPFSCKVNVDAKKGSTDCCWMITMPSCLGCCQGAYDEKATKTKVISEQPK
eukprot:gene7984-13661_t